MNRKKSSKIITMTLLIALMISGCGEKAEKKIVKPTFDLSTAKQEIISANKAFMNFLATKDSLSLANLYTKDAKFMSTGAPAIVGRKNIQSALSGLINSGITRANLSTVEVWGTENLITEEGEVSLFVEKAKVYEGKYLVLWKKVDGKWKLFRDIFNSNLLIE
tara:strand:+ start:1806 stop:2294 length:489 start_codon:yes stop_codon:yes gene_type:complete